MKAGSIRFCVMSRNATNEPNRLMRASVGLAIPRDSQQYGYLSEHHSFGDTEEKAGDYAEDLAATMLATTLGIEFDSSKDWDERKTIQSQREVHYHFQCYPIGSRAQGRIMDDRSRFRRFCLGGEQQIENQIKI